jgi:hypothetical protein
MVRFVPFARADPSASALRADASGFSGRPSRTRRPARIGVRIGMATLIAAVCATSAYADVCADLFARAAHGGAGQESVALSKQLAALQALQRKRGCASRSGGGGFFNACRDLANRKAEVQRRLAKSPGGSAAAVRARLAALGCTSDRRREKRVERVARRVAPSGPSFAANEILFCVRLIDGYFFPVPASQFVDPGDYKETVDQCRFICQGSETAVYRLEDPSLETEEMVSVENGTPYRDLPSAFAYRDSAVPGLRLPELLSPRRRSARPDGNAVQYGECADPGPA